MITFENLNNGELAEKFCMALAQIGYNLKDPNMDPNAKREMTIKIVFKPTGGGALNAEVDVKTKLAGFRKSSTTLLIGQDLRTGRIEISECGGTQTPTQFNAPAYAVQTETIPPQTFQHEPEFDRDTGEIYEPQRGPIDLRTAANQ